MKNTQRGFIKLLLLLIILVIGGYFLWSMRISQPLSTENSLPTTCKDEDGGIPVITSLSSYSASVGNSIEIRGCNFSGFEGDKNAWIKNNDGAEGILYGAQGSTSKVLHVSLTSPLCQTDESYRGLPCEKFLHLTPGIYKIYTIPWSKKSNEVTITIK